MLQPLFFALTGLFDAALMLIESPFADAEIYLCAYGRPGFGLQRALEAQSIFGIVCAGRPGAEKDGKETLPSSEFSLPVRNHVLQGAFHLASALSTVTKCTGNPMLEALFVLAA